MRDTVAMVDNYKIFVYNAARDNNLATLKVSAISHFLPIYPMVCIFYLEIPADTIFRRFRRRSQLFVSSSRFNASDECCVNFSSEIRSFTVVVHRENHTHIIRRWIIELHNGLCRLFTLGKSNCWSNAINVECIPFAMIFLPVNATTLWWRCKR